MNGSLLYRSGVVIMAAAAGVAAGAIVFKFVGEQQIGGQVSVLTSRLGFKAKPGDTGALDLLEQIAPGTKDGFTSAVVMTVMASLLTGAAVTLAIREITS